MMVIMCNCIVNNLLITKNVFTFDNNIKYYANYTK